MKNRLILILAIYSVAGLLALDLHAAPEDDIIGPPTLEDQQGQEQEIPEEKPAPRQPAKPKPQTPKTPRQQEPGDHPEIDRDADGAPNQRPNRPNRPQRPNVEPNAPNYPRGRVEWIKIVCPQARVEFFDFGDSWSLCYVEGTRRRFEVMLDSTGIEIAAGGFGLEIKHTPGSNIAGYYTGDGASIGLPLGIPVGGAGGKFYQIPKRRGEKPLNRATLVGAQFGLGFSVIDGIRIRAR